MMSGLINSALLLIIVLAIFKTFYFLKFSVKLRNALSIFQKLFWALKLKKARDDWKQKFIFYYALKLINISLTIAGIIIGVFCVIFLITFSFDPFLDFLISKFGLFLSFIFAIIITYMCRNKS